MGWYFYGNTLIKASSATARTYREVKDGDIIYRKGIRRRQYVIDYSDDGGVTWILELISIRPDEDSIIITIDEGVDGYRDEVRDGIYCIDAELTPTGFEGTEDTDWENVIQIKPGI